MKKTVTVRLDADVVHRLKRDGVSDVAQCDFAAGDGTEWAEGCLRFAAKPF